MIDHPSNPPSTWHNPRYVWMINPCIVANGPFEVPQGQIADAALSRRSRSMARCRID